MLRRDLAGTRPTIEQEDGGFRPPSLGRLPSRPRNRFEMREVLELTKTFAGSRGDQNVNVLNDGVSATVGHGSGSDRLGLAVIDS